MDEKLKQRLVGAAVLVALAVIFLPMLLDGPPEPVERTVRLGLPERPEFQGEGQVIPLLPDEPAEPATGPALRETPVSDSPLIDPPGMDSAALDAPVVAPSPASQPVSTAAPEPESAGSGSAPVGILPEPDSEPEQPVREATEAALPPEAAPLPEHRDARVSAPPAASQGKPATVPTKSAGGWWVQLGVFSRAENARRLAQRAGEAGYACLAEPLKVSGRSLQRVQCGPWAEKAAARKAREGLLQALGLKEGRLFRSGDEGPETTARTDVSPPLQGWAVQVGSFRTRANAEQLMQRLRKQDFPAYVEALESAQLTRYRVRVGPYASRAQARKSLQQLETRAGMTGAMVVKSP